MIERTTSGVICDVQPGLVRRRVRVPLARGVLGRAARGRLVLGRGLVAIA
jgi:hypothetical protein